MSNPLHIFGVRHHGPGSARSLRAALHALQPNIVLVEGPPDADGVLPLLADAEMQPPVALLVYVPAKPDIAAFYPFAVFSPEYQAIRYALEQQIPVRFMDLAQAHLMAQLADGLAADADAPPDPAPALPPKPPLLDDVRGDPLGVLARAAGYSDGERWWEQMVEQRANSSELFAAILEAMTALRSELDPDEDDLLEQQREAAMRQIIRGAQREGYQRIAVVCGAWHAPVLANPPPAKADTALLKGLPKIKTTATWVPWTYSRLAYRSGYGAGIESPGWYHHLWTAPDHVLIRWMTSIARLLRDADLDASSAHVIEAVRLAEALAALREQSQPGLAETLEAAQAILCGGNPTPLRLIHERLIISDTLGSVPASTPTVPLQRDLELTQKRLRLKPEATRRELPLDLRNQNDRARSHLLHRLNVLGIAWGQQQQVSHQTKGTFKEIWLLEWQPEFAIALIEAAVWGSTVLEASTARATHIASTAPDLPTLTELIDQVLLADLPGAVQYTVERIQAEAAIASDIAHLMTAVPPLAQVLRYRSVRQFDTSTLARVLDGLIVRVCVGLPLACAALNDEAAAVMVTHISHFHATIGLLQDAGHSHQWHTVLHSLAAQEQLHGLVGGRSTRLLLDAGKLTPEEAARRVGLALSPSSQPAHAAAWLEGFLAESGLILLHDATLLGVLDRWLVRLSAEMFTSLLPLLRRTFSTFEPALRRQIGERARHGEAAGSQQAPLIDMERGAQVLPLVTRLLGIGTPTTGETHDHPGRD